MGTKNSGGTGLATGTVFDIREFSVHDGPGIRTTVFLKGCPLRCSWCHNPEGLSPQPQTMSGSGGERTAGQAFTSSELAARLNSQAGLLRAGEGGVTFSGGEPLTQAAFVAEVMDQLDSLHVLLDTSGYAEEKEFRLVVGKADLVYFDLKLADPQLHERYTGVGNERVLRNLRVLSEMGVPFVVRVPLVPGVTDTTANLSEITRLVAGLPGLLRVDLLPYNRAAGGKYAACGMEFRPGFDESRESRVSTTCFEAVGLEARIL
jgi:pyruvate formate lyase activating enzyme